MRGVEGGVVWVWFLSLRSAVQKDQYTSENRKIRWQKITPHHILIKTQGHTTTERQRAENTGRGSGPKQLLQLQNISLFGHFFFWKWILIFLMDVLLEPEVWARHLSVCLSVCLSVRPSVRPSVRHIIHMALLNLISLFLEMSLHSNLNVSSACCFYYCGSNFKFFFKLIHGNFFPQTFFFLSILPFFLLSLLSFLSSFFCRSGVLSFFLAFFLSFFLFCSCRSYLSDFFSVLSFFLSCEQPASCLSMKCLVFSPPCEGCQWLSFWDKLSESAVFPMIGGSLVNQTEETLLKAQETLQVFELISWLACHHIIICWDRELVGFC